MSTPVGDAMSLKPNTTATASLSHQYEIPDEPLVIIQPGNSWGSFNFRELWPHRELLYFLTWRDLKVRYKQTFLGVAWVVMQPILMTLIFTLFLGRLVRVPTDGLPYPLLVFAGLLPWTFFSSAVLGCGQSLVGNATLITKVYFPRVLIPASYVVARLVDFVVSFLVLLALMLFYRLILHYPLAITWNLAALPLMILLMTLLALGLGMLVSCLNVKYRDVGVALPVLMQLWMFASPIVYTTSLVPGRWQILYSLNPLVGVIEGFRATLLGTEFPTFAVAVTAIFATVLLVCASVIFRQTERTFADVV